MMRRRDRKLTFSVNRHQFLFYASLASCKTLHSLADRNNSFNKNETNYNYNYDDKQIENISLNYSGSAGSEMEAAI